MIGLLSKSSLSSRLSLRTNRAPEWVWDHAKQEYVIFWTTRWLPTANLTDKFSPDCDNKAMGDKGSSRFSQWHTRTKDWKIFSDPKMFIDFDCMLDSVAPMKLGDGGYDTDIVYYPGDKTYRAFFKSMQAPSLEIGGKNWDDKNIQPWSGVHMVTSADLHTWSLPQPSPKGLTPQMIGPWGVEGPELLIVNETMHLYYDCSFQPTPAGFPKPPYGVSTAPYPDGFTDLSSWSTVVGSCTGNGTLVEFPIGATQGGFICITNEQFAAIEKKWPVLKEDYLFGSPK